MFALVCLLVHAPTRKQAGQWRSVWVLGTRRLGKRLLDGSHWRVGGRVVSGLPGAIGAPALCQEGPVAPVGQ